GRAGIRDLYRELAAVDLLLAEELVAVNLTRGEHGGSDGRAGGLCFETELLAVQVVSVDDVEANSQPILVGRDLVRVCALGPQDVLRNRVGDDRSAGRVNIARGQPGQAERRRHQNRA